MKQIFLIATIILVFSVTYGNAQMGGGMMGGTMHDDSTSAGSSADAPGYGGHMMGQGMGSGYGGHMGGGMMGLGYGRHMMDSRMMGSGYGGHKMGSCGHMMGPDMMGYGTEEENRKFLDETVGLRREMHNKKFEISEALRNPDTSRKTLLKLKKEILEIQIKMYETAIKIED